MYQLMYQLHVSTRCSFFIPCINSFESLLTVPILTTGCCKCFPVQQEDEEKERQSRTGKGQEGAKGEVTL